jgi:glycosyltransferase involved in cell wall biosynthesis
MENLLRRLWKEARAGKDVLAPPGSRRRSLYEAFRSRVRRGYPIIGISRIRNESELIVDTLRHIETICDGLIIYDDASTDGTPELVERHARKLLALVRGGVWSTNRVAEETRHRALLYERAKAFDPSWVFCFDADERFDTGIRDFLLSADAAAVDGLRIRLFDGYLTPGLLGGYREGTALEDLPRLYGPECRDILMVWRNSALFFYEGLDAREPRSQVAARVVTKDFRCKHFGKCLSVQHWEDTCEYYAKHFPEPYKTKWEQRRGKAIHERSDFGRPLFPWDQVAQHAVRIHPA